MRKNVIKILMISSLVIVFGSCREERKEVEGKETMEKVEGESERGVKRAAEEVKGAYKDVKEEVDGETDDN
ncbi:hypothetical protein [Sediminicola sp. 1XM1-17]|uniref:hypothetical protein n=1 Tax=Sediminicola sp. 1XM1-17 TaxID=3127702 RepID=UPI003077ABB8